MNYHVEERNKEHSAPLKGTVQVISLQLAVRPNYARTATLQSAFTHFLTRLLLRPFGPHSEKKRSDGGMRVYFA
jgi:hypothetical protein